MKSELIIDAHKNLYDSPENSAEWKKSLLKIKVHII